MTEKIEEILERMKRAVGVSSQRQLANILDVAPARINDAKNSGSVPPGWIVKLSTDYGLSPTWLLSGEGPMKAGTRPDEPNVEPGPPLLGRVPLISWVQAGDWTEIVDNLHPGDAEEWLITTAKVGPHAFALKVVGNSMEPEFREGEMVIVDPDRRPESGSFVIAKINHDEATFKQFVRDGGRMYLRPLNEAYPLMDVTDKELIIVGRVVEKVKRY